MTVELSHNRETDVAYVDVCPPVHPEVRVSVMDVTERLGLKTQVLARVTEDGELLGLIIEDYSAFKREVRIKYLAFAVERLLDLLISKVRDAMSSSPGGCHEDRRLAHAH